MWVLSTVTFGVSWPEAPAGASSQPFLILRNPESHVGGRSRHLPGFSSALGERWKLPGVL